MDVCCCLVALRQGLVSVSPSHLFLIFGVPLSTQAAPLALQRVRLTPAQHLQQWLPHAYNSLHIKHLRDTLNTFLIM